MDDLLSPPVAVSLRTPQPSMHSPHDARLCKDNVSKPCKKINAWIGESVAPVSLNKIARILVTNAAGPAAVAKLTP